MNVKIYNKSLLPIVVQNDARGKIVIHPAKFILIGENQAKTVLERYPGACTESDYKKYLEERKKPDRATAPEKKEK